MQELSNAFIALPGGIGTLQETLDILVAKQLKQHQKPLVIVNTNGFYDLFIAQLSEMIQQGFAPKDNARLYYVASTPESAFDYIEFAKNLPLDIKDKLGA